MIRQHQLGIRETWFACNGKLIHHPRKFRSLDFLHGRAKVMPIHWCKLCKLRLRRLLIKQAEMLACALDVLAGRKSQAAAKAVST